MYHYSQAASAIMNAQHRSIMLDSFVHLNFIAASNNSQQTSPRSFIGIAIRIRTRVRISFRNISLIDLLIYRSSTFRLRHTTRQHRHQ
jgi:hypothetical protein